MIQPKSTRNDPQNTRNDPPAEAEDAVTPYGDETFVDLERGKVFRVLMFRREEARRRRAFGFPAEVHQALIARGVAVAGNMEIELADKYKNEPARHGEVFHCYVKIPITLDPEEEATLVEAGRMRYKKPDAMPGTQKG